jgi:hypothetical protein
MVGAQGDIVARCCAWVSRQVPPYCGVLVLSPQIHPIESCYMFGSLVWAPRCRSIQPRPCAWRARAHTNACLLLSVGETLLLTEFLRLGVYPRVAHSARCLRMTTCGSQVVSCFWPLATHCSARKALGIALCMQTMAWSAYTTSSTAPLVLWLVWRTSPDVFLECGVQTKGLWLY